MPPRFCASATMWRHSVVLPEDSGPKISMMRPLGTPPTPNAMSSEMEPVEMAWISRISGSSLPSRMMDPLPNWRSTADMASSIAFSFS
jgi:hypothetical protein